MFDYRLRSQLRPMLCSHWHRGGPHDSQHEARPRTNASTCVHALDCLEEYRFNKLGQLEPGDANKQEWMKIKHTEMCEIEVCFDRRND